ncbi:MAG: hypothetical protein WKF49_01755 [Thermoleophilaceae bacterium]
MGTTGPQRLPRLALAGAVATGAAMVGVAAGGVVGVDRKLEAATPKQAVPISDQHRGQRTSPPKRAHRDRSY